MRTAIKVFLTIGIVLDALLLIYQCSSCIVGIATEITNEGVLIKIIFAVFFGVGTALCALSLSCLDTYRMPLSIAVLFLGNVVAGFLMVFYKDELRQAYLEQRNEKIKVEHEEIRRRNVEDKHKNAFFDDVTVQRRIGMPKNKDEE